MNFHVHICHDNLIYTHAVLTIYSCLLTLPAAVPLFRDLAGLMRACDHARRRRRWGGGCKRGNRVFIINPDPRPDPYPCSPLLRLPAHLHTRSCSHRAARAGNRRNREKVSQLPFPALPPPDRCLPASRSYPAIHPFAPRSLLLLIHPLDGP